MLLRYLDLMETRYLISIELLGLIRFFLMFECFRNSILSYSGNFMSLVFTWSRFNWSIKGISLHNYFNLLFNIISILLLGICNVKAAQK